MRIRIRHETSYAFDQPVRSVMQALRVMPRDHEGQIVVSWHIEPSIDGRLRSSEDPFGNLVHLFQAEGPFDDFTISIDGIVETADMTGFVRGAAEPLPAEVFLRETPRTQPDEAMTLFARKLVRHGQSTLDLMHTLMGALHADIALQAEPDDGGIEVRHGKAADAFALRKGAGDDLAHIFCGCARSLGVPTRFVAGYAAPSADLPQVAARHAWVEAYIPEYGWIGFDAARDLCPTDGHVRVAIGLDHADTMPVRVTRVGGGGEKATARVAVVALDQ